MSHLKQVKLVKQEDDRMDISPASLPSHLSQFGNLPAFLQQSQSAYNTHPNQTTESRVGPLRRKFSERSSIDGK